MGQGHGMGLIWEGCGVFCNRANLSCTEKRIGSGKGIIAKSFRPFQLFLIKQDEETTLVD